MKIRNLFEVKVYLNVGFKDAIRNRVYRDKKQRRTSDFFHDAIYEQKMENMYNNFLNKQIKFADIIQNTSNISCELRKLLIDFKSEKIN